MKLLDNRRAFRRLALAGLSVATLAALAACGASDGTAGGSGDSIVVGTSMPLTGPGVDTCVPIAKGAEAWIKSVNAEGGVNGRKIVDRVEDDAYQASEALTNVREFARDEDVVALFNGCGSPTAAAIAPFAEQQKIPFLFPWADVPGATKTDTFFSLIPSNGDMVSAMATAAMEKDGPGSLYVITLALPGIEESLKDIRAAVEDAGGTYAGDTKVTLNEPDMNSVVLKAKSVGADYIATVTNSSDSAKLINTMASQNAFPAKAVITSTSTPTFGFLSGIDEGVDLTKVLATSVPAAAADESAASCIAAFEKYAPDLEADSLSLTGCSNAQALVSALEAAGDDVTRESILKGLDGFKSEDAAPVLGTLAFAAGDHLGVSQVHAVSFKDGAMVPAFDAPLVGE
ncbi:ABC transporter substrate-binding protein [Aeromicrobium tamlense]|uniref:ABC transporter substrate-binding protein n=1 Tax=Aeromicrobium tamlense TaxID=375541 RepID=A0A8I0FUC7_9ACTN|nr:ABC transporter substrate-binding protein [Aeromicrobium tamlense]MBD1270750.1 ABC transporter substrate-binding protein [Aeromicrobium tamlense]MBD1271118.1 ABC transporter substrate-binding protein [Aeromicrobium tamlense]NYI38142.1 ABC-type branched-subunit amino acid transport system substrate-binding protein [Aeromicrobium tamlense]